MKISNLLMVSLLAAQAVQAAPAARRVPAAPAAPAAPAGPAPSRPSPAPRQAGDAPRTELLAAVAQAQAYAKAHKLDSSRQYLQAAVFDMVARRWTITWQEPNAKGGVTMIEVPEQGAITVQYGE
jgi:hypothetical protein